MHNDVVKSDIHSTDTHGYTETIFGAMHLLGFSFAPRIKNLGKRQRLYVFKGRKDVRTTGLLGGSARSGYMRRIDRAEQWDEILRFIATIRLKEATASHLFRRLNSYSKQHALYRALKAFGKILKSDLLAALYVDDSGAESGHGKSTQQGRKRQYQFSRAISFGNDQEFLYGREGGTGDGRRLSTTDQERHHLLELPLPDAEDRGG